MTEKILSKENKVRRHGFSVRFVHWTVALATLLLIFSGFGQMPMYRRYMVYKIPGMWWSADFNITLMMHYIAAAALIFAVFYHMVVHLLRKDFDIIPRRGDIKQSVQIIKAMLFKGKEPASDKYLAEQRLAYAYIAFCLAVIIVTGMIKVVKNLPSFTFGGNFMVWVNDLHTFASFLLIFGIVAHLAAFLFKANRPLIRGMFTGKVDLEYVQHRHSIWYNRLINKESSGHQKGRRKSSQPGPNNNPTGKSGATTPA